MIDPGGARERAGEILSRSEFAEPGPGPVRRALDWLFEWLGRLFPSLPGSSGGGGIVDALVWIILIAAVGFLAWVLLRARLRRPRSPRSVPRVRSATVAGKTAREWDAVASDAEGRGDWPVAVRARYRGVVARLVDRRIVVQRPGATSGDHRADVARRWESGRTPFDSAADRFDEVWYGGRAAGPDDSERLRRLAEEADTATVDQAVAEKPTVDHATRGRLR